MMSLRYRSSRRIDEPCVRKHRRSYAGFESVLGYEVAFPTQKLRKVQPQSGVLHQAHVRLRQKLDQQIDIAIRPHLAPRGRSKQREFPNLVSPAEVGQLGLVNLDI